MLPLFLLTAPPLLPAAEHLESWRGAPLAQAHPDLVLLEMQIFPLLRTSNTKPLGLSHPTLAPAGGLCLPFYLKELKGSWLGYGSVIWEDRSCLKWIGLPGVSILPTKRKSVLPFPALTPLKAIKCDRDRRHLSVGKCECCILYPQQGWKLSCLLGGHPKGQE